MCYNEVSVENEIILGIFAEKGPYNMTMWFVVPLIVTDTTVNTSDPKTSALSLIITGSNDGLLSGLHPANTWINADLLSIGATVFGIGTIYNQTQYTGHAQCTQLPCYD